MTTMNLRSFKSLEKLGIKWKNWSYQTCQHKIALLDFRCLSFWKTDQVIKRPLGWMHQKINGYKDRQRKGLWRLSYDDSRISLVGIMSFCVCVCDRKPVLFYVWCNNASVFIQKTMSLPLALHVI